MSEHASRLVWGVSGAVVVLLFTTVGGCDSEVAAGGGGAAGSGGTLLDDACAELATKFCGARQGCCEVSGLGFDSTSCRTREFALCQANARDVEAGTMTFNPDSIDPCLAALEPYLDMCFIGVAERMKMFPVHELCRSIFEGHVALGESCERDAQCAPAPDPDELTYCSEGSGHCEQIQSWGAYEYCIIGGGFNVWCADGLFCDADQQGMPPHSGQCQPATALGQPCAVDLQPSTLECGMGYLCDPATGTCQTAKEPGEPCSSEIECRSAMCTYQNVCGGLNLAVNAEACNGSG